MKALVLLSFLFSLNILAGGLDFSEYNLPGKLRSGMSSHKIEHGDLFTLSQSDATCVVRRDIDENLSFDCVKNKKNVFKKLKCLVSTMVRFTYMVLLFP